MKKLMISILFRQDRGDVVKTRAIKYLIHSKYLITVAAITASAR